MGGELLVIASPSNAVLAEEADAEKPGLSGLIRKARDGCREQLHVSEGQLCFLCTRQMLLDYAVRTRTLWRRLARAESLLCAIAFEAGRTQTQHAKEQHI